MYSSIRRQISLSIENPPLSEEKPVALAGIVMLSDVHYEQGYKVLHPAWHGRALYMEVERPKKTIADRAMKLTFELEEVLPVGVVG